MYATARDMRFHTGALLDTVAHGEEVIITYHGVPKAKLVPLEGEATEATDTDAFGMWRNRKSMADPAAYVRNLRRRRFE